MWPPPLFLFKQSAKKLVFSNKFLKEIFQRIFKKRERLNLCYSRKNINNLNKFKNIHQGERAFLIGMGPSLKISDLELLKNEITFACNKIYLAFEETNWRPTYYSVSDTLVAKNNHEIINQLNLTSFHRDNVSKYIHEKSHITWLRDLRTINKEVKFWNRVDLGAFRGGSVLYLQIQLAIWMGIKEIYIIGADYSFDVPEGTGEKSDVGEILINDNQSNHFHPDYRKKGETWAKPNLQMQFDAFSLAKNYCQKHRIKIYNASRQTKLEVFERVNFDSINLKTNYEEMGSRIS